MSTESSKERVPTQGPDGKWNKFSGRYAWDAGWLCSNLSEQFGGTGAKKPDAMVFPSAPNLDHSQVRVSASSPRLHRSWPGLFDWLACLVARRL